MYWLSPELPARGDHIAVWSGETLALAGVGADALYLATPDAGAREALAFWRAAQQTGFAFAAPGDFPWTLANSAAGRISQRLGIRGPCTTYVGGEEAEQEARTQAADDLAAGLVSRPLIVRLRSDRPVSATDSTVRIQLQATLGC